jgi:hypothetical protein
MSLYNNVVGGIDNLREEMMKKERRRLERRESANNFSGENALVFSRSTFFRPHSDQRINEYPQSIAVRNQFRKEL